MGAVVGYYCSVGAGPDIVEASDTIGSGDTCAVVKMRSPAREKVPMMSRRTSQTMTATKTGIALVRVAALITAAGLKIAVVEDGDRHAPPGEGGVEARRQHPRAKEIIDFGGFVTALFGGEDAGDTGKVDAAEGDGEDGRPAHTCECQVAEHVVQGILGGAEVEDFEREQGADDHDAPGRSTVELTVMDDAVPEISQAISKRITTVCTSFRPPCRIGVAGF